MQASIDISLKDLFASGKRCPLMLGKSCMGHNCMLWVWADLDSKPTLTATTTGTQHDMPEQPAGHGWVAVGEPYFHLSGHNEGVVEQKWSRGYDETARGHCARATQGD